MKLEGKYLEFYNTCLDELKDRHGDAKYYLSSLQRYVFTSVKAGELAEELMNEAAIIQHTNKAEKTNLASSPKLRMFALLNEQAIKLGRELGLQLVTSKVGRPAEAKGFKLDGKMKAA